MLLEWLVKGQTVRMLLEGKPGEGDKKKDLEKDEWLMLNWT
jgi:hypothetical protein